MVFDAEGLSRAIRKDQYIQDVVNEVIIQKTQVVISAATIVEVMSDNVNSAALNWTISRFRVIPVTKKLALLAAGLLRETRKAGHDWALDAMIAATALELEGRPTVYTSDPGDMRILLGRNARIVPLT